MILLGQKAASFVDSVRNARNWPTFNVHKPTDLPSIPICDEAASGGHCVKYGLLKSSSVQKI
jgi:hypothetical protein